MDFDALIILLNKVSLQIVPTYLKLFLSLSLQPFFPGENSVDQLVEIIKVKSPLLD